MPQCSLKREFQLNANFSTIAGSVKVFVSYSISERMRINTAARSEEDFSVGVKRRKYIIHMYLSKIGSYFN